MGPWGYFNKIPMWETTALVGVSADGLCVAIPDLDAGRVTTVADAGNQLIVGFWQITRQQQTVGGLAVSVRLPAMVSIPKDGGPCTSSPANLTATFRGPNLGAVLTQAANAWCQQV